jgi:NTP pyrophosphatase (non-canonical NTP hydrolase)
MTFYRALSHQCACLQQASTATETALVDSDMGALLDALTSVVLHAHAMANILGLPLVENIDFVQEQHEKTHPHRHAAPGHLPGFPG